MAQVPPCLMMLEIIWERRLCRDADGVDAVWGPCGRPAWLYPHTALFHSWNDANG